MRRFGLLAVCLLVSLRVFGLDPNTYMTEKVNVFSHEAAEAWKPTFQSLDEWVSRVGRKEWKVLYKSETKEDYMALFLDGDQHLVVASWRHDGVQEFALADVKGEDQKDAFALNDRTQLLFKVDFTFPDYVDPDSGRVIPQTSDMMWAMGFVYVIKKDYTGKLHIVVRIPSGSERKVARVVLDTNLQWPVEGGGK